jgi:hypothetical protein
MVHFAGVNRALVGMVLPAHRETLHLACATVTIQDNAPANSTGSPRSSNSSCGGESLDCLLHVTAFNPQIPVSESGMSGQSSCGCDYTAARAAVQHASVKSPGILYFRRAS